MILAIIPVAISVFISASREVPVTSEPILAVQGYKIEKAADNRIEIALNITNIGSLGAREVRAIVVGEVYTSPLEPTAIEEIFSRIRSFIREGDKAMKNRGTSNIESTRGQMYHVIDVDKVKKLLDLDASTIHSKILTVDPRGKDEFLYFFIYSRYSDDLIDRGTYWEQSICGFYAGTDAYYHECKPGERPNHVMANRF